MNNKKLSEKIKELADKEWRSGIDPYFYGEPQSHDYLNAIIKYLDELHEELKSDRQYLKDKWYDKFGENI